MFYSYVLFSKHALTLCCLQLEQAEKECARYKDLVENRLKPAEAQNKKMRATIENQKVAYTRLDKELSRLHHIEADLNDSKIQLEQAATQFVELEVLFQFNVT